MEGWLVTIAMFGALLVCIAIGVPLAFGLGAVGVIFTYFLWGHGALVVVASKTMQTLNQELFIAIPLFILMGTVLQKSGLADALYTMVYRWAGRIPGALAMGTIVICTFIAAMSGVSGAAVASLGIIALPSMLKRNYDKRIAVGTIAAGSTLCLLIPPSITLILFGAMSNVSIGQLFLAGVFPGVLLALLFIIYLVIHTRLYPTHMPALPPDERASWTEKLRSLNVAAPVLFIITGVLGSIFTGAATPTEASAIGATATIVVVAIYRRLNWELIKASSILALSVAAMVMWILVGASIFSSVYQALGATAFLGSIVMEVEASQWVLIGGILFIVLLLGMFLDPGAIILILVPILVPVVERLGINFLWFAILFNIALMIGFLSPPFGLVLFYLRGVCPPEVTIEDIYRSVIPFIILEIVGIIILVLFPEIVLWLPRVVMGAQ